MRLIDADSLFEKLDENSWYDNADRDIAEDLVLSAPTIDTESLRPRGRWKDACYYHDCPLCYECSNCGLKLMYKPNYCPHCGSFMENKNGENYAKK